jgi:hypothetical protein
MKPKSTSKTHQAFNKVMDDASPDQIRDEINAAVAPKETSSFDAWWESFQPKEDRFKKLNPEYSSFLTDKESARNVWDAARRGLVPRSEAPPINHRYEDALEHLYQLRLQFRNCAKIAEGYCRVSHHEPNADFSRKDRFGSGASEVCWTRAANFVSEAIEELSRPQ